jgi:site-specific recombinase XerD
MSRPNKIWFRKDIGCWMVTLGGKRIRLADGRENKKLAQQKFHELAAEQPKAPEAASARVADVIEAFLAWTKIHRSEETNRNYLWFGQAFSEHSGYLPVAELKPIHVTRWVDGKGWNQTTQRNARRSIHRAFSWACEEGILARNPLQGMKCPRAMTRTRFMTDAEFRSLMRNSALDFKLLLFSLQQTGCRPKEAQTLTWDKVREDRWVLTDHKTAYKVQKPRVIYLTAPMRKLMAVLRSRSTGPHVFLNRQKKPWTNNASHVSGVLPNAFVSRMAISGLMPDLPLMTLLSACRVTPSSFAPSVTDSPDGSRHALRTIRPGWAGFFSMFTSRQNQSACREDALP